MLRLVRKEIEDIKRKLAQAGALTDKRRAELEEQLKTLESLAAKMANAAAKRF